MVASVSIGQRWQGAEIARQKDGFGLGFEHQRRVEGDFVVHPQPESLFQRLDRRLPAVGIAAVVGLGDAGDQMMDAALIGQGGSEGQEDQVAPRHEGVR